MKVLYEYADYKIILEDRPNENAVKLLHTTLWGTNGPLFQHLDTPQKVNYLKNALSFTLEKKDRSIGTCTVLQREINHQNNSYITWYGRYFTIDKEYQGKIFGNLLLKHMRIYLEQISDLPTIFYAYVDQANPRSSKLLRHTGLKIIRSFETLIFSRLFPKRDTRVSRIKSDEVNHILLLLKKQYDNNLFVNFDNLFFQNNYFVLKNENEIIAGAQASVVKWKVRHLPGLTGKIMIKVLPFVPVISRLFNPKDFRFVAFEGIYCKKGHEKELFNLMESVCAELKLNTGILWLDSECELRERIKHAGNWGLMNKMKRDSPAYVVAGFRNVPEAEQEIFYSNPTYISSFDLT